MAKEREDGLYFIYGVFLALLTLAVGILFVAQAWALYRSAPQSPYTRESIAKFFQPIIIPLCAWFAALFGNLILSITYAKVRRTPKAQTDVRRALNNVKKRIPEEKLAQAKAVETRGRRTRLIVGVVIGVLLVAAAALSLAILLDKLYFPLFQGEFFEGSNGAADRLAQVTLLALFVLALTCVAAWICGVSRRKERERYLAILATKPVEAVAEEGEIEQNAEGSVWDGVIRSIVGKLFLEEEKTTEEINEEITDVLVPKREVEAVEEPVVVKPLRVRKERKARPKLAGICKWTARLVLLAGGVFLVYLGVQNGGMQDVLAKAINICTQCIGLG